MKKLVSLLMFVSLIGIQWGCDSETDNASPIIQVSTQTDPQNQPSPSSATEPSPSVSQPDSSAVNPAVPIAESSQSSNLPPIETPQSESQPTPQPEPEPVTPPTPEPSACKSPFTNPLPQPPSQPSDPYIDEVISHSAGVFNADKLPNIVLGGPRGYGNGSGSLDVFGLGLRGEIVLKSTTPILDGEGVDFIVFENPFGYGALVFSEPGQVWVSQDGVDFIPFPCDAQNSAKNYPGCAGTHPVFANIDNNQISPIDATQAGGDAYDLNDLCIDWIQYIKIVDQGFYSGFDLDAISIIHQ